MSTLSNTALVGLITRMQNRGFGVSEVVVKTPDGRSWSVVYVPAGVGRKDDGSWGTTKDAAGFRLFELDRIGHNEPEEHDAIEGDKWDAGDLVDYLDAVGKVRVVSPS